MNIKIEEVARILEKVYWQGRRHHDIPITSISVQSEVEEICQLFETKPIKCYFDEGGACNATVCYSTTRCGARDPLGKPIYKVMKPEFDASRLLTFKEIEQVKLKEPITFRAGLLIAQDEKTASIKDAECQEKLNDLTFKLGEVASKACQAKVERIFKFLKDHNDFNTCTAGTGGGYGLLLSIKNWQALKRDEGIK